MFVKLVRSIPETNSSSSHFILINEEEKRDIPLFFKLMINNYLTFGWGPELIEDYNTIIAYFCAQAYYNECLKELINLLKQNGIYISQEMEIKIKNIDIDHQSVYKLYTPNNYIKALFLFELCCYVLKHGKLLIYNDNMTLEKIDNYDKFKVIEPLYKVYIFKNGNYWILIEKHIEYKKYIVSFNKNFYKTPIFPEQIDIKITDRCFENCSYCHESSNPYGKYADISLIIDVIKTPYGGLIPEITLGGGDPFLYPHLDDLIKFILNNNSILSFTLHYSYFIDENKFSRVKEIVSMGNDKIINFGISLTSCFEKNKKNLKKLIENIENNIQKLRDEYYNCDLNFVYHFIDVILSTKDIINFLNNIEYGNILILGFKKVGRGKKYSSINHIELDKLVEYLQKHQNKDIKLAIDEVYYDNWAYLYFPEDDIYPINKVSEDYKPKNKVEHEIGIKESLMKNYNEYLLYKDDSFMLNKNNKVRVIIDNEYMYFDAVNKKFSWNSNIEKEYLIDYEDGMDILSMWKRLKG